MVIASVMSLFFVFADAGTPLMWFGCLQLTLGNVGISYLERAIFCRITKRSCTADAFLVANFSSMIVGFALAWLAEPLRRLFLHDPFETGRVFLACAWVLSFFVTLAAETPILALKLRFHLRDRLLWRGAIWANLGSYAVLLPIYFTVGPSSALRIAAGRTHAMDAVHGWLYYKTTDGRAVRRIRMDGSSSEFVLEIDPPSMSRHEYVFVIQDFDHTKAQLWVSRDTSHGSYAAVKTVGAPDQAAQPYRWLNRDSLEPAVMFDSGGLTFRTGDYAIGGYWAAVGLRYHDKRYAFETPFAAYTWDLPTVLPNGLLLVGFADGVYLMDLDAEKAYRICDGKSPSLLPPESNRPCRQ